MTIAATTGIWLPAWVPIAQYNDTNRLVAEGTSREASSWRNFAAAWNAVSYRLRIASEDLQQLQHRWALDLSPPPEDRLAEERLLLSAVSNSIAAFECCALGLYCVAAVAAPSVCPLDEYSLRNLYPKQISDALSAVPGAERLRQALNTALWSPTYQQLKEIRDFLTHRGSLPRLIRFSTVHPHPSAIPSNPKAPGQDWAFDLDLTTDLLQAWSQWLAATLADLIQHGHALASSKLIRNPGNGPA